MILADKIIRLRKKNGWSQEELAEKVNVSRQAVSKWEGAQSVPDLEKLLVLSRLFGVTTDYLLKDEIEDEEFLSDDGDATVRKLSLSQAQAFLAWRASAAKRIALATLLCIISPITLIVLGVLCEIPSLGISENFAGGAGMIVLILTVAVAVAIFMHCGFKNSPYEFLDGKEAFETEYGVRGMVTEKREAYRPTYVKLNILGTCISILSPIALFIGAFSENEILMVAMLSLMIVTAGIGVVLFITAGVRWASMQKLLREGDFLVKNSECKRKKNKIVSAISGIYWCTATAIFLVWTVAAENSWQHSWIMWPVAGILYGAIMIICSFCINEDE